MPEQPPIGQNPQNGATEERLTEAALWLERLSGGADANTQASFDRWLAASPQNPAAFEDAQHMQESMKGAASQPEILALRQQTLARVALVRPAARWHGLRFLRWGRHGEPSEQAASNANGKGRAAVAAGLAACLLAGGGIWAVGSGLSWREMPAEQPPAAMTYRTAVGEQTTIQLADGSQIVLNTDSAVQVAFSDSARRLTLEHGEAFFTVAKDQNRPFSVVADGRVVTAFGTAFDVRIQNKTVQVALLEGKVSVSPGGDVHREAVKLQPNDLLIAGKDTVQVLKLTNPASFTAWRDGLLVFQNDTLRTAVEEMNRYSTTQITLDNDSAARLRVSGTFRIGQTTAFLEALHEMFPIRTVRRGPDEIVIAEK